MRLWNSIKFDLNDKFLFVDIDMSLTSNIKSKTKKVGETETTENEEREIHYCGDKSAHKEWYTIGNQLRGRIYRILSNIITFKRFRDGTIDFGRGIIRESELPKLADTIDKIKHGGVLNTDVGSLDDYNHNQFGIKFTLDYDFEEIFPGQKLAIDNAIRITTQCMHDVILNAAIGNHDSLRNALNRMDLSFFNPAQRQAIEEWRKSLRSAIRKEVKPVDPVPFNREETLDDLARVAPAFGDLIAQAKNNLKPVVEPVEEVKETKVIEEAKAPEVISIPLPAPKKKPLTLADMLRVQNS